MSAAVMASPGAAAEQVVAAYSSYDYPPFHMPELGSDMGRETIAYLNRKLAPDVRLQLEVVPRARLVKAVLDPAGERFDAVVLFLNPRFLKTPERYLWTAPVATHANVMVFRSGEVPTSHDIEDLAGKQFVGLPNHRYPLLDDMVAEGKLRRHDGASERSNLLMVAAGRADFGYINRSLFRKYSDEAELRGKLVARAISGQIEFTRHLLVGRAAPALHERLERIVAGMKNDPAWLALLRRYEHEPPALPSPARARAPE